jgi:hypothetical protein
MTRTPLVFRGCGTDDRASGGRRSERPTSSVGTENAEGQCRQSGQAWASSWSPSKHERHAAASQGPALTHADRATAEGAPGDAADARIRDYKADVAGSNPAPPTTHLIAISAGGVFLAYKGGPRSPVARLLWFDVQGRRRPTLACWICGREVAPTRSRRPPEPRAEDPTAAERLALAAVSPVDRARTAADARPARPRPPAVDRGGSPA